jgi:hypothetical protein
VVSDRDHTEVFCTRVYRCGVGAAFLHKQTANLDSIRKCRA